jgi:hypothetical protein
LIPVGEVLHNWRVRAYPEGVDRKWRISRFGLVFLIVIAALFVVGTIEASGVLLGTAGVLLLILALAASGGGPTMMGGTGRSPRYDPDRDSKIDGYDGD